MRTSVFVFGVIAMYAVMMTFANADPMARFNSVNPKKLKLGSGTEFIYSPVNSTLFGLSLKSAVSAAKDGLRSSIENSSEANPNWTDALMTIGSVALGAQHQLNDQWAVSANLAWIKSDLYNDLTQSSPPDIIVPVVWDETTRYVLGVIFMPADRWAVGAKVSLEKPFINFLSENDQAVPDQSRLWLAATVDYQIHNDLSFDLEYTRLSIKDAEPFSKHVLNDASGDDHAVAERHSSLDVISATLTIQF